VRLAALFAIAVAIVPGCHARGASGPPGKGTIVVRVRRNPAMVVSAFVDIDAPGEKRAVVHYGGASTPELTLDGNGHATTVLLGLRPAATTRIEVETRSGRSAPIAFTADSLPADIELPDVQITVDDGTASGYLLAAFVTPRGKLAVVLDRKGRTLWYRPLAGDAVGVFRRLPNGRFIAYNWPARVFEEVDLAGAVARRWVPQPPAADDGADGHEFLPLSNDRAMVIGWSGHVVDSHALFSDGVADAERRDNAAIELTPSGDSRVVWSSYPTVALEEIRFIPEAHTDPARFETVHMNAIDVNDDLAVITLRELQQVVAVDRKSGKVRFRLGGKKGDLDIVGDPLVAPSAVHDARLLPNHRLRIFDNGNTRNPPESRVVVYEVDESKHTARFVWQYRHDPPVYTWIGGSAREVPGGRLLVNFTWRGVITEVDAEQRVHWELRAPHQGAYRVEWIPTLYPSP
jgi:hypothetical protein